jgi:tetratricopeptide (TPR) repeat protein
MDRKSFPPFFLILCILFPVYGFNSGADSLRLEQINLQGREYAILGDFDGAERAFISILALDSNSIFARNNLGIIYKMLGRNNDALRVYSEAENLIKRDGDILSPYLATIYLNKGIVYNQKQDFELALQYMESALNIRIQAIF